ncbi:hypothetical protein PV726_25065 [Streptomyces europaeiscabiei]|uniref:DUF7691 family protein n=1 Tax=Streptomyces europaeiscabiei TaxID=146819 RepID=UPI0029A24708|nr:hypothetical protein [Streptomyces europaeiscabiei]MDX3693559.1 hypothetical protein [Streptomyces europaeiscabiei]
MSSSLSVYVLDVAATRGLVGSSDEQLLDVVRAEFADDLARDDDWCRSETEAGAPTASEALRAVVYGGPFSEDKGHAFQCGYGYAYKRLCSLTGGVSEQQLLHPAPGRLAVGGGQRG